MSKKYDVVALGELLIDFTQNGLSSQGNTLFEANPGGAPCNVLAVLQKLGHQTAFIGKVGNDIFGKKLCDVLDELGIDRSSLVLDKEVRTTLAFVETKDDGDRDFSFYRNPGADMMLKESEVSVDALKNTKIFHFGSVSMTHEPVRTATYKAIQTAKESGAILSFDPNLREPLWDSLKEARECIHKGLLNCDILKISDNEVQWFTGKTDYIEGIEIIKEEYNIPLILLSMGKNGSRAYYKDKIIEAAPFLQKDTVETTGAGDTFGGACLHYILEHDFMHLDEEKLKEMLVFANAAASIITTRRGALRVMPEKKEIEKLILAERR